MHYDPKRSQCRDIQDPAAIQVPDSASAVANKYEMWRPTMGVPSAATGRASRTRKTRDLAKE